VTPVTDLPAGRAHTKGMSTLTTEMTVGELAAQVPASVRVLERLGIDYCCGGGVAFDQACRERNLVPAAVRAEIDAAGQLTQTAVDWPTAPIGSLVDHILSTHHVFTKAELPRLNDLLVKILSKHSERHGDVLQPLAEIFRGLMQELEGHLLKEEMILFPLIRSIEAGGDGSFHCGSIHNPIRVMMMEHDSAGDALAKLRTLTNGYSAPPDACATFRAFYAGLEDLEKDLHQHIHLENNILFPRCTAGNLVAGVPTNPR
jgi:regulator of cell morphogenesis and NO signaling